MTKFNGMSNSILIPMKATVICCLVFLFTPKTHAQFLGGDLRNATLNIGEGMSGDVSLNVQTGDDGKSQATGGVTVKQGDRVSFDYRGNLATPTAGFWQGEERSNYRVSLKDEYGVYDFGILELQGLVRWDTNRNVIEGADNVLRIAKRAKKPKYIAIVTRKLLNGCLQVTTEHQEQFFIYGLSPNFTATASRNRIIGIFEGASFQDTERGWKLVIAGARGELKNEINETIATGELFAIPGVLAPWGRPDFPAIRGSKGATFLHSPNPEPLPKDTYAGLPPGVFPDIQLKSPNTWVLRDANFIFLLEPPSSRGEKIRKVDIDKSLLRASIIALPEGTFRFWGYIINVKQGGGTLKILHGEIIDSSNTDVSTNTTPE